ncbi:MAG: aldehyde dehydrogenase family protein, partial [Oceanisphaera sp.]|nr:aldehyde dehydrogenase family protein [Oceanisphaera sp.]
MTEAVQYSDAVQYINGQWLAGEGEVFVSLDPAKNEEIWQGAAASAEQVDAAIAAAREAAVAWADAGIEQRLAIAKRYAELLTEHKEHLAHIIAR